MELTADRIRHATAVAHLVARRMHWTGREHEDMVQDVLVRVLERIDDYDPDRAPFGVWVGVMGRSILLQHWKMAHYPMRWTGHRDLSLYEPAARWSDGDETSIADTLAAESHEYDDTQRKVRDAVNAVLAGGRFAKANTERARKSARKQARTLVEMRILADEPATLQECAEAERCTRENMRQREMRFLASLRKELAARRIAA